MSRLPIHLPPLDAAVAAPLVLVTMAGIVALMWLIDPYRGLR